MENLDITVKAILETHIEDEEYLNVVKKKFSTKTTIEEMLVWAHRERKQRENSFNDGIKNEEEPHATYIKNLEVCAYSLEHQQ